MLFISMNDLLVEDVVVIPLVWRNEVVAVSHALQGLELSTWDSNLWDLAYWYRQRLTADFLLTPPVLLCYGKMEKGGTSDADRRSRSFANGCTVWWKARRAVDSLWTMLRLGLSAPFVANLLATYTPAAAQGARATPTAFTPTTRGGGGRLRLLWWQAPTILNVHLSTGTKDNDASRVVHEP